MVIGDFVFIPPVSHLALMTIFDVPFHESLLAAIPGVWATTLRSTLSYVLLPRVCRRKTLQDQKTSETKSPAEASFEYAYISRLGSMPPKIGVIGIQRHSQVRDTKAKPYMSTWQVSSAGKTVKDSKRTPRIAYVGSTRDRFSSDQYTSKLRWLYLDRRFSYEELRRDRSTGLICVMKEASARGDLISVVQTTEAINFKASENF